MSAQPTTPRESIKALLSARRLGHDANQLLVDIMEIWGGTKQFARDLHVEFQAAKAGSLIRQNLLEMIQKLVVNNTNHNITRIVNPADLDDDEIDAELQAAIRRAAEFTDEQQHPAVATHSPPWYQEDEPPGWDT